MSSVQCSHILVKHRESRRPSSWREESITRNKDEALKQLEGSVSMDGSITRSSHFCQVHKIITELEAPAVTRWSAVVRCVQAV